jgi:hypothetical protein
VSRSRLMAVRHAARKVEVIDGAGFHAARYVTACRRRRA